MVVIPRLSRLILIAWQTANTRTSVRSIVGGLGNGTQVSPDYTVIRTQDLVMASSHPNTPAEPGHDIDLPKFAWKRGTNV